MKNTLEKLQNMLSLDSDGELARYMDSAMDLSDSSCIFRPGNSLYLGRFSADDMFSLMQQVGMISHLEQRGFTQLNVTVDSDEAGVNYLKFYSGKPGPDNMLMDLRVAETRYMADAAFFPEKAPVPTYDMVVIEWLSLQNTKKESFDSDRPQLPGQTKPGLGILVYCFEMMYAVARMVSKDGFLDMPEHLHGALMYSKKFRFFDPVTEAVIRGIQRDLSSWPMSDLSWGVITNTIIDENTGLPEKYVPSAQIYAASPRMKEYFESAKYIRTFKKTLASRKYRFDHDRMLQLRSEILRTKKISDV